MISANDVVAVVGLVAIFVGGWIELQRVLRLIEQERDRE